MTPKKRIASSQAPAFMHRLLAEWITGEPVENADYQTEWMERGQELEDQAVSAYESIADVETKPGGFITDDLGLIGCSPDRLIGDDGDLEIKCPLLHTQVGYALNRAVDEDYMTQLQGRMYITGRQWVDIFSFHPRLMIPVIRVKRDETFIEDLARELKRFVGVMLDARILLDKNYGPFTRPEPAPEPDHSKDWLTDDDATAIWEAGRK
jgi:hypothetical protein